VIPSFRGKGNLLAKVGSWELGRVENSNGRLSACYYTISRRMAREESITGYLLTGRRIAGWLGGFFIFL